MADLKVLTRGFTKEIKVNQIIFRDVDDNSHGYVFESNEQGLFINTVRKEENFRKCVNAFQNGEMSMEEKTVKKTVKYPTTALCQCEHLIEMNDGITICPHCRSIYDRKGREVFF